MLAEVNAFALESRQVSRDGGLQILLDQEVQRLRVKSSYLPNILQPLGREAALNQC